MKNQKQRIYIASIARPVATDPNNPNSDFANLVVSIQYLDIRTKSGQFFLVNGCVAYQQAEPPQPAGPRLALQGWAGRSRAWRERMQAAKETIMHPSTCGKQKADLWADKKNSE